MATLNDLIIGLGTVLVRYHDIQIYNCNLSHEPLISRNPTSNDRIPSWNLAKKIVNTSDFESTFKEINSKWADKYPERIPFANYILELIKNLKAIQSRKNPFNAEELENSVQYITAIFSDFKTLFATGKSHQCSVAQQMIGNTVFISLNGWLDDGLMRRGSLCCSAQYVKDEILEFFKIQFLSTEEQKDEFKVIATEICQQVQTALNEQTKSEELILAKQALQKELDTKASAQPSKSEDELRTAEDELRTAQQEIIKQQRRISTQQDRIAELLDRVSIQQDKILEQSKTISDLQKAHEQKMQLITKEPTPVFSSLLQGSPPNGTGFQYRGAHAPFTLFPSLPGTKKPSISLDPNTPGNSGNH